MRKQKLHRGIVAILLCAAFWAAGLLPPQPIEAATNYDAQIAEINNNIEQLKSEQKAIEANIAGARTEKAQEEQKRVYIDQQIKLTKDEINELLKLIDVLEQDINDKKDEIAQKEQEISATNDLFLKRMRVMYMYDDTTMLGLILGADSYTKVLTQADTMTRIAEHDRLLLAALAEQMTELEAAKAELDTRLEELEDKREDTQIQQHTLNGQMQAANLNIQSLSAMEQAYLADLEQNKAMYKAMEAELQEIHRQIEWDKNPYVGGSMAWPVPGFYKVTSEFGWRFNNSDFHTGIDLAGPSASGAGIYGAKVVAANSGTIKYTNWTYSPGRGYGIYIIVDHGGGVSTMYAHLSNILVKVGDTVAAGQAIGEVGSTGWSTGPHLHFEVRLNGDPTNPRPYIFG